MIFNDKLVIIKRQFPNNREHRLRLSTVNNFGQIFPDFFRLVLWCPSDLVTLAQAELQTGNLHTNKSIPEAPNSSSSSFRLVYKSHKASHFSRNFMLPLNGV